MTVHRGILHIFPLPNLENNLGFYESKTGWKLIESKEFDIQPLSELLNCNLETSFVTCNIRKFGQLAVINDY